MKGRSDQPVFIGIDCGATTSKVCGVDGTGKPLSEKLRQQPTRGEAGPSVIIDGWMDAVGRFLREEGYGWDRVGGVGLAIPGPYRSYGVLGLQPNLPPDLDGWAFLKDLTFAVERVAGRRVPVLTANDGQLAGLGEAGPIQRAEAGAVLMLAPGSGLGVSFVGSSGHLLTGDHGAAAILCHMPAPHEKLGLPAWPCGCGRDWGCFEVYTSIAGLPRLLDHFLPEYPNHPLAMTAVPMKQRVLSLRDLAQKDDALALRIFDLQARALGYAVAVGAMAYDPTHIVIGGGLMDPESTSEAFRLRYLNGVRAAAADYAWVSVDQWRFHIASLGERSQGVGAALLAKRSVS